MTKKRTKLAEKAARIPDTRPSQWQKKLERYIADVAPLNKESARSHRFAALIQDLLGVDPDFIEKFVAGIEQSLKVTQKDRILRGRADNLFGNVIIEFEASIPRKRAEAEEQVRRYTAILWSRESPEQRTPYLCIVTDGVRFVTYSPVLSDVTAKHVGPDDVRLQVPEETDWNKLKADEIFYWLDRYLCRNEVLHPTSESIVRDFGAQSHAFTTATHALLRLWSEHKNESDFAVVYDSWEKYLRIVYGSEVGADELFIRHTYLATLAKLMAWMRITEATSLPEDPAIIEMLEGRLFKAQGIENFIEEDFFSWLARGEAVKVAVAFARQIFSLLQNYNLRELSEDVFKSLYQQLVDPDTRHDLGEYYTPDWVAHRIVKKLIAKKPEASMLDPACGSGTFLYLAIREKRQKLGDSQGSLRHILDSVCGADIHPLAVIIAKTNYVLALGDLLKKRRGGIAIPIYLADTIRLPQRFMSGRQYEVRIDSQSLFIDEALIDDPSLYDHSIELAKDFAEQSKKRPITLAGFRNFLAAQRFGTATDSEEFVQAVYGIVETLKRFIDAERDSIWAFVLKNIYKPLFFRDRFDCIVGNPPWISFRYMEPEYQKFLKRQIVVDYELLTGHVENIPNLEVATLFLLRTADLYLKNGGTVGFVLPRSLFSADQHDELRRRTFKLNVNSRQTLFWREIWDCEPVAPLFNVPSCVLFAEKLGKGVMRSPIPGQQLVGNLTRRNAALPEAESTLKVIPTDFSLHTRGKRSFWAVGANATHSDASYYLKRFSRAVNAILPQAFWFVEVAQSAVGFNPSLPPVQTAKRALLLSKKAWQGLAIKGNIETEFLYSTLLATDLVPFWDLGHRLVVLPIESHRGGFGLLNSQTAKKRGFLHLAQWLETVEREWDRRRGAKAEKMDAYEYLDLFGGLTRQNPHTEYRVVYNKSGTFLTAAIVRNKPIEFDVSGQTLLTRGFISDQTTYHYETNNRKEASYLVAILNAPFVDEEIKPMQSRGLFGPRDIHKKPLELPIPRFDPNDPVHKQLANLGDECTKKVQAWLAQGGAGSIKSIGKLRSTVRIMLKDELQTIDGLVRSILV